jgi:hypothetical protein
MASGGRSSSLRPDGRALDSVALGHTQPFGDWQGIPAPNDQRGVHISRKTATIKWAGERMDYEWATEVLMQRLAKRLAASVSRRFAKSFLIELLRSAKASDLDERNWSKGRTPDDS